MKKVLITGIAGFVGANLARSLLETGREIHGIVRPDSNLWKLGEIKSKIILHAGDLTDKDSARKTILEIKPEVVYHLAVYGAYPNQAEAELIYQSSFLATSYLLDAALGAGVSVIVNAGSSSEYGAKDHPMREDEIIEPNSNYAVGKAAQTLLCRNFSREHKLPIITLRLFSVYGPFEEKGRFILTALLNALENKDIPIADPKTARDFVFAEDVVEAFIKAGERKDLGGEIFNIGTGKEETLLSAAELVKKVTKSSSKIVSGAYPDRPFDVSTWQADVSKAKKILGWQAKTSFEEGLKKTLEWVKGNKSIYEK
jgi:nucleoside-diphosphate-sugar epimerase